MTPWSPRGPAGLPRRSLLAAAALALAGCAAGPPPAPESRPGAVPAPKPGPAPASSAARAPGTRAPAPQAGPEALPAPETPPADDRVRPERAERLEEIERGHASWYGLRFHGRRTASGDRYDMNALTAAHRTLPFGTMVRVRSLLNGREIDVRITDRGPHVAGRIIDLSYAAAQALDMPALGLKEVVLFRLPDAPVDALPPWTPAPAAKPKVSRTRRPARRRQ